MDTSRPPRSYTAVELAAAVNRELGTDLTARTIYFYRSKGVLSPLVMIGSQPKFTERHRLELKAALAMQRAFDRPSLDEVSARIRALDDRELMSLSTVVQPTTDEMIGRIGRVQGRRQGAGEYPVPGEAVEATYGRVAESPAAFCYAERAEPLRSEPSRAGPLLAGTPRRRTIEVCDGVALRVSADLPDAFVSGLASCVRSYCQQHEEVFTK